MLKFLKLVSLLELREAMYSTNSRGYNEEDVPEKKRFRANLSDAFLAGQITAARTASLLRMLKLLVPLVWTTWPLWETRAA